MRTRGVGGRRVHFQVGDEDVVRRRRGWSSYSITKKRSSTKALPSLQGVSGQAEGRMRDDVM